MPNYLRLFGCIAAVACLSVSCTTELPLPGASAEQKIVLLGELAAGDTALIRAGQSTPLSAGSAPALIQDLSLRLKDESGAVTALLGAEDHLSYTLFTAPYSHSQVIAAGKTYEISGTHPRLAGVSATVRIPQPFTATLTASSRTIHNADSVMSFEFAINDPRAAQAWYVIEAVKQPVSIYGYFYFNGNEYFINDYRRMYDSLKREGIPFTERYDTSYSGVYSRQQMYTTDASSENLTGSTAARLFRRIFIPGKSFGGTTHTTRILLPAYSLYGLYGAFGQYAQTIIYVKSVSADYYNFLKTYEQYDPTMGLGGNANPTKLEGNVRGGFGVVGGAYRWQFGMIY